MTDTKQVITRRRRDTIIAYKTVFNSKEGQKVLLDLMKSCHVMGTTFSSDPYETAYNEGARSVVLRIIKTINVDPKQMEELLKLGQSEDYYANTDTVN